MKQILFLSSAPLDNDNRILKEISSLTKKGYLITMVSVNTKQTYDFKSVVLNMKFGALWGIPGINRLLFMYRYLKIIPKKTKFDIVHCHDLDTLPFGYIIQKKYINDIKIVYDAHEYETEINGLVGIKKLFVQYIEKFFMQYVDKTITVSNSIANEYIRLYGIEKPTLVLNTPPYAEITKKNIFREKYKINNEKIIFLYQGALNEGRGVNELLEVFKKMENTTHIIMFMGYGVLEEKIKSASIKYKNIFFHPAVSPKILLDYTSSADFGISIIEDSCLSYRYCLPNKVFEYIMAEIPVIVSNLPEMKKLIQDNNVGIVLGKNDDLNLENAIYDAAKLGKEHFKKNILKVKKVYNWEAQEKKLIALYSTIYLGGVY